MPARRGSFIITPWQVWATLVTLAVAGCILLGVLGTISFFRPDPPAAPARSGFRRDMAPNCNEVFFCLNATDPNPSYIEFQTPPLTPFVNDYQFAQGGAFDLSDPEKVTILESGIFVFTGFFSVLTAAPEEIAVLITANNETLLTAPVVDGTLAVTTTFDILGNATIGVCRFASMARMSAGTVLRVGFVTSGDAFITPGAHWAGLKVAG